MYTCAFVIQGGIYIEVKCGAVDCISGEKTDDHFTRSAGKYGGFGGSSSLISDIACTCELCNLGEGLFMQPKVSDLD